ncbi:hypothetical protein KSF_036680 [Reticulibacter mediterranei]|uniref:Uncharacterized protein n=1 Tax=Reticulibacter mediterranei TaxID=2778369 RepID=A0A8J3IJH8_9CHLR|nr:hypothetical protein KSF_036680 [Reticulibacter mediterranei]
MDSNHKAEAGANQLYRIAERQIDPTLKAALMGAAGLYEVGQFEKAREILDLIGYAAP